MRAHFVLVAVLAGAVLVLRNGEDQPSTPLGSLGMVDVGGRPLYLTCLGDGNPTVFPEAGGTGNTENRSSVQPDIADFTRVCAYDRAGEGYSSSVPAYNSVEAMGHDLHALLSATEIEGPYVMVGLSDGGRLVRSFGSLYPGEVVGMVLLDPGHEDFMARAQATLAPKEWRQYVEGSEGTISRMREAQGTWDVEPEPPEDFPSVVISASQFIDRPEVPDDVDEKLHSALVGLHKELVALARPRAPTSQLLGVVM